MDEVQLDCIDEALNLLIDSIVEDDASEEEFEKGANLVLNTYADMVDNEQIKETPEDDASEDEKQAWISIELPKLKLRMDSGDSEMAQHNG
jgi:hypothetical protein